MFTATRFSLSVLGPLLVTIAISAQEPMAPQTAPPPDLHKIHLDVVVTPKNGKPVTGLQQQDFTVLDNKSPRPITSFRAVAGKDPVSVILVVDAVNATFQQVNYERGELDKFLKANDGHLAYPTSLAFFTDDGTQIQQGFGTDGNEMSESVRAFAQGLRTVRRSSGIYGAQERLQFSLKTLQQLAIVESARPGRKLILWISPGWPLLSGPGVMLDSKQEQQIFNEVVGLSTQLRLARITLYGVDPLGAGQSVGTTTYYQAYLKGVTKPGKVDIGDLGLQVLAVQSGGLALAGNNDISAFLQQCVADAEAYYEVSFDPPAAEKPNEYHSIDIQLDKPGLTPRTRTGYYSQP